MCNYTILGIASFNRSPAMMEEIRDAFTGKAVKIVSVEKETEDRVIIKVYKDELEKILLHEDVKDLNIAVLSVTGEARIGKSFYIDRLRRFLLSQQQQASYRRNLRKFFFFFAFFCKR